MLKAWLIDLLELVDANAVFVVTTLLSYALLLGDHIIILNQYRATALFAFAVAARKPWAPP